MTAEIEKMLSPSQAARRIGVSDSTVAIWLRTGKLPAIRTAIGNLIRPEDVDVLARQRAERMT
ncbi:MAG TPA: helix-turn-helix domain-containing protein [Chloroflexota bacterium]|nr:helix-turn-helix domain-containing protein [Chloroflexota bacterium]